MIEFTCPDCGRRIVLATEPLPDPLRCLACAWLLDAGMSEAERERARARLGLTPQRYDPTEWESSVA